MLAKEFATSDQLEGIFSEASSSSLKSKKRQKTNKYFGSSSFHKPSLRHDGKLVRGGILADSVGLGKTYIASSIIAANPKKHTLVVTLPSTTIQWCDTIISFTGIKPHSYLSTRLGYLIDCPEIVVTTYNCVRMRPPWLMYTHWDRVILDEGHVIRNPKTATFRSLIEVKADIRWVLSATPIHNGDNDIKTLFQWIGFDTDSIPIDDLTRNFMLRRTMESERHRTPEVDLPPLEVMNVMLELSPEELNVYKSIENSGNNENSEDDPAKEDGADTNTVMPPILTPTDVASAGTMKDNDDKIDNNKNKINRAKRSGDLLRRISQMRQFCVSEHVMIRARQTREQMERVDSDFADDDYDIAEMGICIPLDDTDKAALGSPAKPSSHESANMKTLHNADEVSRLIDQSRPTLPPPQLSTKMSRLCEMVLQDLSDDPDVKIVIFTSFLSEMEMLFTELGRRSIGCTRIHGGLSPLQRSPQIQTFANRDSGISVLLAQIMCTSTGINLQCASIAYITSPSWNPCIEEQAIGRLHRQGQTRPVKIRRLIMRDTVEMRCLDIQQRKLALIRKNVERSLAPKDSAARNKSIAAEAAVAALAKRGLPPQSTLSTSIKRDKPDKPEPEPEPELMPMPEPETETESATRLADLDIHLDMVIKQNAMERDRQRKEDAVDVQKLSLAELEKLAGLSV